MKYRIPNTSVVNRVGDCAICGVRLTGAQWLWFTNLLCFATHTTLVFVTMYLAYWRSDLPTYTNDPYEMQLYRVASKWTNATSEAFTFELVKTGWTMNIAYLVVTFFALSAGFHLFALLFGLFECGWFAYHRQIDDCFCWWR